MAKKSTKAQQGSVTSLNLVFNGGLNYSESDANIADNEMKRALNIIYNSQTGVPETRPGTSCQTAAKCSGDNPILQGYYYEKSSSEKWHIAACNGKLYYLSGVDLDAWTEIGSLNDSSTVPSFITFNSKLLIADGGTNIKTWDGSTYDALDDGLEATALSTIKGRVVANSTAAGSNDLVTFSGPYDETKWDTSTEGAVAIRAGFGDNMEVNAFAVFGDDLVVSKRGDAEKRFYRINVASALETDWYSQILSENNSAQNAHCMVGAFNDVFFVDTNGFKSLKGVQQYGDLQIDLVGSKVNTLFGNSDCDGISYIPLYTSVWYLINTRVFAYHRIADGQGNIINAFTDMIFQWGRVTSVYQSGDDVFLCGYNGYLYKLDPDLGSDEVSPGVTENFPCIIKSKQFSFFGGGILRRADLQISPISSGDAILVAITPNETTTIKMITLVEPEGDVYSLTGDVSDWNDFVYSADDGTNYEVSRNRVRGNSIQFEISSTSGQFGVTGLKAEVALVGG